MWHTFTDADGNTHTEELQPYMGYLVRSPAPMRIAINPAPYKYNELRYMASTVYETSEARKRRENGA